MRMAPAGSGHPTDAIPAAVLTDRSRAPWWPAPSLVVAYRVFRARPEPIATFHPVRFAERPMPRALARPFLRLAPNNSAPFAVAMGRPTTISASQRPRERA